jgi:hypothetical protein
MNKGNTSISTALEEEAARVRLPCAGSVQHPIAMGRPLHAVEEFDATMPSKSKKRPETSIRQPAPGD